MSLHIAITRRVRPGCGLAFEEKLQRFAQMSLQLPGTRGVQLLHPAPGAGPQEYGILRSFASVADRDAFYASPLFQQWQQDIASLVEGGPDNRELHGLEAWFRQPGQPQPPPWKMALVTLLGVYPTSLLLGMLMVPCLQGLPEALVSFLMAAGMVACLTWVVMPMVTKALHGWLHA
ncbi:MAG: antibiotic biosynthesis monooxygenase [Prosthecobacter sp.]